MKTYEIRIGGKLVGMVEAASGDAAVSAAYATPAIRAAKNRALRYGRNASRMDCREVA